MSVVFFLTMSEVVHISHKKGSFTNLSDSLALLSVNHVIPDHNIAKKINGVDVEYQYNEDETPIELPHPHEIRIATIGNVDAGKCLHPDTMVVMADGTKTCANDIDVGDEVLGQDMKPASVTYVETGNSEFVSVNKLVPEYSPITGLTVRTKPIFKATLNHKLSLRVKNILHDDTPDYKFPDKGHFSITLVCYNPDRLEEIDGFLYDTHDHSQPLLVAHNITETDIKTYCLKVATIRNSVWYLPRNSIIDISCYDFLSLDTSVRQCLMGIQVQKTNVKSNVGDVDDFNVKIVEFQISVSMCNEYDEYVGIEVNNDNHRMLVEDNVVTHNSTTVGVIKSQIPDNGKGSARINIFRHQHEIDSGRTSDVGNQYIQYGNRLFSFSDLAGHEGYLRTTIYGLVSTPIDWAMLVVSANQGMMKMTREHLVIAIQLKLNLFTVVTKTDLAPSNVLESNLETLQKIIRKVKRIPVIIKNKTDLESYYSLITKKTVDGKAITGVMDTASVYKFVPVFLVSNVKMINMDLLQTFIFNMRSLQDWSAEVSKSPVFVIDKTYMVDGVGLVLSGTVKHGVFKKGESYMMGPFDKVYYPIMIKNIRDNTETDIPEVSAGFSACFNIRAKDNKDKAMIARGNIEKGMVVTKMPTSTRGFWATIVIVHHPTKISVGYEPHLHCGGVKKTMKIIHMDKENIQARQKTDALLEFTGSSSYVEVGDKFIFREGNTRGSGTVNRLADEMEIQAYRQKNNIVVKDKKKKSGR